MDVLPLDLVHQIFSYILIHVSFIANPKSSSLDQFQHMQTSDYEDVTVDLESIEYTIFNITNEIEYRQLFFGKKFNQVFPLFSNIKICNLPFYGYTLSNEKLLECSKLRLPTEFMLQYCFHVQYLDLSEIVFLEQKQVQYIGKLVKQSKCLKTILANHSFAVDDSFSILGSVVNSLFFNQSLQGIYILQGSYSDQHLERFALEQEKAFLEAKERNLSYIPSTINHSLKHLQIVDCVLRHGASRLQSFIIHQQTLDSLILSHCNPLFLFKAWSTHYETPLIHSLSRKIRFISVTNAQFDNLLLQDVKKVLSSPNCKLEGLSIQFTHSISNIPLFQSAFAMNHSLKELDLSSNRITADFAKEMLPFLSKHTRLRVLRLDRNDLREQGVAFLREALASNPQNQLQELTLTKNFIGASSIEDLYSIVIHCTHLKLLDVSFNKIGNALLPFCEKLVESTLPTMPVVRIYGNAMSETLGKAAAKLSPKFITDHIFFNPY